MPLFPAGATPDLRNALAWVREHFPKSSPVLNIQTEGEASTAEIPGGTLGFAHVDAPVPSGDLQGPVACAWHWPDAAKVVAAHNSHIICFASSNAMDAIDLRLLHSRVVAGLAATGGGTAVYVGSSMLVKDAAAYINEIEAADRDSIPLLSWLGFNPVTHDGYCSAYTTGMKEFGLLELEIRHSKMGWSEMLGFLADVAHYEITAGTQIADGETVGVSESDRRTVRHVTSAFIPDVDVALICADAAA
jgi:hypothetical protein